MTSTVPDRNRFDEYLDLFNSTNKEGIEVDGNRVPDQRVALYLHWLTSTMTNPTTPPQLPDKAKDTLMKQKFYEKGNNKNDPDDISSEWTKAYQDWNLKPREQKDANSMAVKTVQKLASVPNTENSLRGRMVRIVEEHYAVYKDNNELENNSKWGEANKLIIKDINPLHNYLAYISKANTNGISSEVNKADNMSDLLVNGKLVFSLKMDKHVMKEYLDSIYQLQKNTKSTGSQQFFNVDTGVKEHVFYRKMDDTSKLYMKDKDGNEIEVQRGSKHHKDLERGSNCFNIGFKGADDQCNKLITNCLAGRDVQKCKEFMKASNYWQDAEKSVEKMLPGMAVDLLKGFGFEVIKTTDSNDNTVNAMENVSSWSEKLKNHLNTSELEDVLKNEPLMGYLRMVVKRVNNNPAILNPNVTVEGELNTEVDKNDYFVRMGLGKRVPEKRTRMANYVPLMRERNKSLLTIRQIVGTILKPYRIVSGVGVGALRPMGGIMMTGGSSAPVAEYLEDLKSPESEPFRVSEIAETALESLYTRLSQNGKDLDQTDKQTIDKLVKELKNTEEKLFKAVIYLDKYVGLKEALGKTNMGANEDVTLDKMKEYVDKHMDRTNLKQHNLIDVLERFVNAVEEASNTNEPKQSKGTLPKSY